MDTKFEAARLAAEHEAQILVSIFQSDVDALGLGVCRGVVQYWLANHFDAIEIGDPEILNIARENLAKIGSKKASMFISVHEDIQFTKSKTDSKFVSLGRKAGIKVENDQLSLGQITVCFDALFPQNGFYFVGLPKHCFGLRREADHILFIDANTCEWRVPTKNSLHKKFLIDHTATFYPENIFERIWTIHFP